jgi:hypothetical protein
MLCVQLHAEFVNPGGDYLSSGDGPLPTLLAVLAVVFGSLLVAWIVHLLRHAQEVG